MQVLSKETCRKACVLAILLLVLVLLASAFANETKELTTPPEPNPMSSNNTILPPIIPPVVLKSNDFCPVSRDLNVSENFLFTYPIDVYSRSGDPRTRLRRRRLRTTLPYNCSARRVGVFSQHRCPAAYTRDITCPVTHDHVHLTLNSTSWKVFNSHGMIQMLDRIFIQNSTSKKEGVTQMPLRILFFGGSVTAGHETEGYCCSNTHHLDSQQKQQLDSRCNFANDCSHHFSHLLSNFHYDHTVSWVKYFSRALVANSHIPLEIHSLPAPGTTSNYMAAHVSGYLNKLPSRAESNSCSDLIFIDYSYNDGKVFQGPKRSMLDQAIESLVRNILTAYSTTLSGRPHIVLIESYVHSFGILGKKCNSASRSGGLRNRSGNDSSSSSSSSSSSDSDSDSAVMCTSSGHPISNNQHSNDYSVAYRRIAQYYGLQVWSPRNIYWAANRPGQPDDVFVNFMLQGHPPWHTHLLWADVFLSVMKAGLREKLLALHAAGTAPMSPYERHEQTGNGRMIDPLVKAEDISSQQCDWNSPLLADLSFDLNGGNFKPLSNYTTDPPGSWQFVNEGGDKPGLVTQQSFRNHTLELPFNSNVLLQWLAGKSKHERLDRLVHRDIVIIFSYLKSYENMLTVSLELCGHTVASESGLWTDHFSLSYTSVLPIGHFIEHHCDDFINQLLATEEPLLHSSMILKIHSPSPLHADDADSLGSKFKLLGLTVCETDTGGTPYLKHDKNNFLW